MSSLTISLLESFKAPLNDQPVENLHAKPVRALLINLAVERSSALRRETLCSLLWPGMPEKSTRHHLSQILYALRQAFSTVPGSRGDGSMPLLVAEYSLTPPLRLKWICAKWIAY